MLSLLNARIVVGIYIWYTIYYIVYINREVFFAPTIRGWLYTDTRFALRLSYLQSANTLNRQPGKSLFAFFFFVILSDHGLTDYLIPLTNIQLININIYSHSKIKFTSELIFMSVWLSYFLFVQREELINRHQNKWFY